jgi:hypothetical protein
MVKTPLGASRPNSTRNYRNVPHYDIQTLSRSPELEYIASTVELFLCRLGFSGEEAVFIDQDAAKLLELFFDQYHFKTPGPDGMGAAPSKNYDLLQEMITEDLSDIPAEDLVRVLAFLYREIQRRTKGGDEYLRFINEHSGE